jgi:tol-pal system protein YbgF
VALGQRAIALAGIVLAAGLLLAGCAEQNDVDELRTDQMKIRGMIASQNQQIQSLQQVIRREQDRIDQLEHGPGGAEGGNDRFAALQQRVDKLDAAVSAMQTGGGAAVAPPAGGSGEVSASAPSEAPPAGAAPSSAPAPAAPGWQAEMDKELSGPISGAGAKAYREGLQAMKAANYQTATNRFSLLLKRYPKSPLTEPGEFFLANALFESGKYDQSILQFNDLVMRYPKGRFASAALLREAEAFLKLNDKIDARLTLQKLLADHAESPEAAQANEMMKDLQG